MFLHLLVEIYSNLATKSFLIYLWWLLIYLWWLLIYSLIYHLVVLDLLVVALDLPLFSVLQFRAFSTFLMRWFLT